jgi:hypothetical protein
MYEFHYSALDRPYFMRSDLHELLRHAGLAGVALLTRAEWGVLRAMLGRPRRLSLAFLREERVRLEHYRCGRRRWLARRRCWGQGARGCCAPGPPSSSACGCCGRPALLSSRHP